MQFFSRKYFSLVFISFMVFSFLVLSFPFLNFASSYRNQSLAISLPFLASGVYFLIFPKNPLGRLHDKTPSLIFFTIFLFFFFHLFFIKTPLTILLYIISSALHLLYAGFLSSFFHDDKIKKIKIYSLELIGFILACMITPLLIDSINIIFTYWAFFFLWFFYFLLFYKKEKLHFILFPISLLIALTLFFRNTSAMDWTTYGSIQASPSLDENSYDYLLIGKLAKSRLPTKKGINIFIQSHLAHFIKQLSPKEITVLFAGGGVEAIGIKKIFPRAKVSSVEINSKIINHSTYFKGSLLPLALKNKEIELVNKDARIFIQNSNKNYDLILSSFHGIQKHFLNSVQFMETEEAFLSLINHLAPEGTLIFQGPDETTLQTVLWANKKLSKENSIQTIIAVRSPLAASINYNHHFFIISKLPQEKINPLAMASFSKENDILLSIDIDSVYKKKEMIHEINQTLFHDYSNKFTTFLTDDKPFRNQNKSQDATSLLKSFLFFLFGGSIFFSTISIAKKNKNLEKFLIAFVCGITTSFFLAIFQQRLFLFVGSPTITFMTSSFLSLMGAILSPLFLVILKSKKKFFYSFLIVIGIQFFFQMTSLDTIPWGLKALPVVFVFTFLSGIFYSFIFLKTPTSLFLRLWGVNLIAIFIGTNVGFFSYRFFGGVDSLNYVLGFELLLVFVRLFQSSDLFA